MYIVKILPSADKELRKLDLAMQERIVMTLDRIKVRPHHFIKKYIDTPYYILRVGDYRIILNIEDNQLIILVIEIGHRKNIYKK
jgi:mRNA interferase RelE/StbE